MIICAGGHDNSGGAEIINSDMPLPSVRMLPLESEVSCASGKNKQFLNLQIIGTDILLNILNSGFI